MLNTGGRKLSVPLLFWLDSEAFFFFCLCSSQHWLHACTVASFSVVEQLKMMKMTTMMGVCLCLDTSVNGMEVSIPKQYILESEF